MGIIKKNEKRITIDIDGEQGNAFVLLGFASRYAKQLDFDEKKIGAEMTTGDYLHLLKTFNKYFGSVVDLATNNQEYLDAFDEKK